MILVLLPAYNEARALLALLPKIKRTLESLDTAYTVVVCNDGSRDGTKPLLDMFAGHMPLHILEHKINRGLGETIRDLFEYAADVSGPNDIFVRMDADDTHDPDVIPSLIARLDQGFDVVTASRFLPGGGQLGVSPGRAFISSGANRFMKLFFPIKGINEYSCGFRGYRAGIIKQAIDLYGNYFIQLKDFGFAETLEKVVKLQLLGARFGEVPFILRYDQKVGASKMAAGKTILGYLIMVLCYYWPWGGWKSSRRNTNT
ncbi:MAG: glycosyltransferase [Deltaproteobacteria bacterium]|nr:glycosyltransferase [Deltaproteobacteria bacterium]